MTSSSSSTIASNNQPSSTSTSVTSVETSYLAQLVNAQSKPQSIGQIKAAGEVKTRIGVIWFVGIISTLLIIIGGSALIFNPESAKDVWVIIGPILSSTMTGTVAFLTGEKQGSKN